MYRPTSRRLHTFVPAACLVLCAGMAARAQERSPHPLMLRNPDVSATHVCFVYANDLWVAPREGGPAARLASPPGREAFPRFSPDGRTIAFMGNYDGNTDLYTIPVEGGIPTRVTHHGAGENLSDWTPDGRLLFFTNAWSNMARQTEIYAVPASGGMPERIPVPYGAFGAISPDGTWLAYTQHTTDSRTWKRYRGGMATDIWLFNLKDYSSKLVTEWEGTDSLPMWHGTGVYYVSDAGPEHRLNIWRFDTASGQRSQVTNFSDNDVRWPSIGPGPAGTGEIVFQLGSSLMLLDLSSGRSSQVRVSIPGDLPAIRPQAKDASRTIQGADLSPTGKRVAIGARGDIWSAPAKEGPVRNLTRSDSVHERFPAWSPDGRWIAYFSDESGEYDLYVMPSDGRPAEPKDEKKDAEKDADGADAGPSAPKPVPHIPRGGARRLTDLGPGFRFGVTWSPDSKHMAYTDDAGNVRITTLESGETKLIDTDPWTNQPSFSWSSDSAWLAYERADDAGGNTQIALYHLESGQRHLVTDAKFNSSNPAFDRKGDYLFFKSNRQFSSPMYADLDTTWIYANTELLYVVPLRADMKSPWAPRSDEEEIKEDKKPEKPEPGKDGANDDAEKKPDAPPADAAANPVSGTWEGKAMGGGEGMPPDGLPFTMNLTLHEDGSVTGSLASAMGTGTITAGRFDKATGELSLTALMGDATVTLTGTITGEEISGTWTVAEQSGTWTAKRTAAGGAGGDDAAKPADKKDEPKKVKIDLEGLERRAVQIPVPPGNFGSLAVSHDNKLLYVRAGSRGSSVEPGIKIFDLTDEAREEKAVTAGGGFGISADGKKLLVSGGGGMRIVDAAAGGGKAQTVSTAGMTTVINPRSEWRQILLEVYRLQRDYFYEPTLHHVDWKAMHEHYAAMLDDCANREDVNYLIAEMISELNVGHAYLGAPGDVEGGTPQVGVGLLACDFALDSTPEGTAYRIARIVEGAPWEPDARGPLSQPGVDVRAGDYLLAVDGVPLDTTKDPYAAFQNTVGRAVTLTVSAKPVIDADARDVLVTPIASETAIRYRAWIEKNRRYVEEKTNGQVGYIHVPDTGINGQNELYRQFTGQRAKPALIIDERWNGGGQIPTRFIELLNRPIVNYWARRHGNDWPWPPDSHQGPKCMLINGLAGSGGDAFPKYFKQAGLGKLIGRRTWGGLVGISGNPGLIDGGSITVPTFGYYETDGTWGVEGHGVDPDIEVIDDPALMVNGGDPQLDKAIEVMLDELKTRPYVKPKRPESPDRRGMGIKEEDK